MSLAMNCCPACSGRFPDDLPTAPICLCGLWASPEDEEVPEVTDYPPETAAGLLKTREDWLSVIAIPAQRGGFRVALVLDGVYSAEHYDPAEMTRQWKTRIEDVMREEGLPLGVPLAECPGKAKVLGGAGPVDGSVISEIPPPDHTPET